MEQALSERQAALRPADVDFCLDSLLSAPIKGVQQTMEFPFFCLTKKPRTTPLIYNDGMVKIEISPGADGMATIWDKDVLIYCASLINERIERGASVERRIIVPGHDILKVCQRGTGKHSYDLLLKALARLRGTTIKTNVLAGNERERSGFGWIDNYRVVERLDSRGKTIMAGVEIWLNQWMFRAIVNERRVLSLDQAYFKLKMGLERRIYELARKHCGRQARWDIGMPRLQEKCGTGNLLRNFKDDLKTIIERDSLPGYRMALLFDGNAELVRGMKTDGYDIPPRWGGNNRIVVRFAPRADVSKAVDM